MALQLLKNPLPQGGEADLGKGPVDLFPAERVHTVLVHPGRNGRAEGINKRQHFIDFSLPILLPSRGTEVPEGEGARCVF